MRITPPSLLPPHHSGPATRDFQSSISVEALLWAIGPIASGVSCQPPDLWARRTRGSFGFDSLQDKFWMDYSLLACWVFLDQTPWLLFFFCCSFLRGYYSRAALYNTNIPSASSPIVITYVGCRILATATIWGWCFFRSELPIVLLLFNGSVYSAKYSSCGSYVYTTYSSLKLVAVFRPLGFFMLTATQTQTGHATDSCIPQTEQREPWVVLGWRNAA